MKAYDIIFNRLASDIADGAGMYAEGMRPVIYTLFDQYHNTIFRGTYKETIAFLDGCRAIKNILNNYKIR